MPAPPTDAKIYHIAHVDRLASIVADGELRCDTVMSGLSGRGTTIGMGSIKSSRMTRLVTCHPGDTVAEYVPFYFCSRSVMLYLIHKANHPELAYRGGQGPIVHLEADLAAAMDWADAHGRRWAFSLSNAAAAYAQFRSDRTDLDQIKWDAVAARDWRASDVREGKQAEFLMHMSFPWPLVTRIGVGSTSVYGQVQTILANAGHRPVIELKTDWYY